jgi:hypothetical protein
MKEPKKSVRGRRERFSSTFCLPVRAAIGGKIDAGHQSTILALRTAIIA